MTDEQLPTVAEQVAAWPEELQQAWQQAREEIAVRHDSRPVRHELEPLAVALPRSIAKDLVLEDGDPVPRVGAPNLRRWLEPHVNGRNHFVI